MAPPADEAGDVLAVLVLSRLMSDAASRIEALRNSIHLELRSAYWFGPRADDVRTTWERSVGPAMIDNAERLRALSRQMLVRGP